jgi:hypothetical protein
MQGKKTGKGIARKQKLEETRDFNPADYQPPRERLDLVIKLLPFCMLKVNPSGGTYDTGWRDLNDE